MQFSARALCFAACLLALTCTPEVSRAGWGAAEFLDTSENSVVGDPRVSFNAHGDGFAVWAQPGINNLCIYSRRYVTGFGWTDVVLLSQDLESASEAQVAVAESGDAFAVWSQYDGTRRNIWANHYVTGSGWGSAVLIETDNGNNAANPQIGLDERGNAIAVWSTYNGTVGDIWANRYAAGAGWGPAGKIEVAVGATNSPQIAMDLSGNAIAVWTQKDGTNNYNTWANRFVAGSGWGPAERIETDDLWSSGGPRIAMDGSGNAMVVWSYERYVGTRFNYGTWARRYVAGSGWDPAVRVDVDDAGYAGTQPQISVDGSGNAVAVWQRSNGTRVDVWANRYVANGSWGTATLIETDNAGDVRYPQVAVDGSGNAVAVWSQSDGTRNNTWANRYVAGGSWGTATLVEADNAGPAYPPQVAVDGAGNAIAVWSQSDGTRNNTVANRYVAGRDWGTSCLLESDNTGSALLPQVVVDGTGNAMAVWKQSDGVRYNIWANRYGAIGGWGAAGLIETENIGDADAPQVAVDGSGNATAVWQQRGSAGGDDLWANRYVAGGSWGTTAVKIETNNEGNALSPQVAVDGSGNAIAVWQNGSVAMWANRYVSGGAWGPVEEQISTTVEFVSENEAQVAMDGSGNAIAVWNHWDPTSRINNIVANRYVVNVGWGDPILIESNDAGEAVSPQVAVDGSGNAIAVWEQSDGTRSSVWANRYTAASNTWGAAVLLETSDYGHALDPQIAMDGSGNAIAVWSQVVGSWSNIYANRYTLGAGWGTATLIENIPGSIFDPPQIAVDNVGNAIAVFIIENEVYANRYTAGVGWDTISRIVGNAAQKANPQVSSNSDGVALAIWQQLEPITGRYDIYSTIYDISPPRTNSSLPGGAHNSAQTVTLSCSDTGSGCNHIYYTTDGATPTIDSKIYSSQLTVSATTSLKYFATDKYGNSEAIHTQTYIVDPDPPVTSANPSGGRYKVGQFVSLTCADGVGGGCDTTWYCLGVGCIPTTPFSGTPIGVPSTNTLRFSSLDKAGNREEPVSEQNYTIDMVFPNTTILTQNSTSNPSNLSSAILVFEANESSTFECSLDGAGFSPCIVPARYSSLGEGSHTFQTRATDLAGNTDATPASYTWVIDTQKPVTTADPRGASGLGEPVSVQLACADTGLGCNGTTYRLNGGAWTPYATPILIQDAATLEFSSVDVLGNQELVKTETYGFTQVATKLSIMLSSQTIKQTDTIDVSGSLSEFSTADINLEGLTVTLTVTPPPGSGLAIMTYTTTTDSVYGHYIKENIGGFGVKGTYGIQAHFAGTGLLQPADSSTQALLAGNSSGYAVIVEGKIANDADGLQSHNKTTNRVYQYLLDRGFATSNIFYYNYTAGQPGVDGVPSKAAVQNAIEVLVKDKMNGVAAPLWVVLVDHGSPGQFHLGDEVITPAELDTWLDSLEGALNEPAKREKRVVVIGACYSGSFIETLKQPPAAGNGGRLIMTSATAGEESYKGPQEPDGVRSGEFFIEELFKELVQGTSIRDAFVKATGNTKSFTGQGSESANNANPYGDRSVQHPLLEDDGDGIGSNSLSDGEGDGVEAAALYLGVGLTNSAANPADLKQVTETVYLDALTREVQLWAQPAVHAYVDTAWIEVKSPTTVLAGKGGSAQLELDIPRVFLRPNDAQKLWSYIYGTDCVDEGCFDTPGRYDIYYFTRNAYTDEISEMRRSVVYRNWADNPQPTDFSLLAPTDGSVQPTVLRLAWSASTDPDCIAPGCVPPVGVPAAGGAVTYTVMISRYSDFRLPLDYLREEIPISMVALDQDAGLERGVTYYWKVWAVDAYGAHRSSAVRGFTISDTNPGFPGFVEGCVTDAAFPGRAVPSLAVSASAGSVLVSGTCYSIYGNPGAADITATASGYFDATVTATVISGATTTKNISLRPTDTTPATVLEANSASANGHYKAGAAISVTVIFSEVVSSAGLTISLNSGGSVSTGALSGVTSYSGTYTVGAGQTSADLSIGAITGTITNLAGNPSLNPAVPAGHNIADTRAIVIDTTAPSVAIGAPSVALSKFGPVSFTVTYADANFSASTLATGDVTLIKTGTAKGTVEVTGSGTTRTVRIIDLAGSGTLRISLAAGTATDIAGNSAPACGPSATFQVDNVETPIDITLSKATVAENEAAGTSVGTLGTVDPEVDDTFVYTLVPGAGDTDNSVFQIAGSDLQTAAIFNYEARRTYSIRVRTTDHGGLCVREGVRHHRDRCQRDTNGHHAHEHGGAGEAAGRDGGGYARHGRSGRGPDVHLHARCRHGGQRQSSPSRSRGTRCRRARASSRPRRVPTRSGCARPTRADSGMRRPSRSRCRRSSTSSGTSRRRGGSTSGTWTG